MTSVRHNTNIEIAKTQKHALASLSPSRESDRFEALASKQGEGANAHPRPLTLFASLRSKAVPLPQGERGVCRPGAHRRCGFTLMEVLVAASVIGVLFLTSIPLLSHVRRVRQEADRRMIAQQEAANVMESVAALATHTELTDADLEPLKLSPAADRLPDAVLDVSRDESPAPLSGRRITVSVAWTTDAGSTSPPAQLSAWFPITGGE